MYSNDGDAMNRSARVFIRMTPYQKERLRTRARAKGQTISQHVQEAVFGQEGTVEHKLSALEQMLKIIISMLEGREK